MTITFRTYCGLAGDLDELLIGETPDKRHDASRFVPRTGFVWYRLWRIKRAKKQIINEIELNSGIRCYEQNS